MKGKVLLVLLSGVLFGCSSAPAKFPLGDNAAANCGRDVAKTNECARRGIITPGAAYRYSYSMTQFLGLTAYDPETYSREYRQQVDEMISDTDQEAVDSYCVSLSMQLPQAQTEVERAYGNALAWQQRQGSSGDTFTRTMNMIAGGMAVGGTTQGNAYAQPVQPIPMPTGEVTFGQSGTSNSNYLVNTPSGTVLCNVSSSGFVNCY